MAQKKFSDLTKVAEIKKADLLALEQADGTKQATFEQLCAAIAVQEITEQVEDLPEIEEEDTLNVIAGKINKSKADMLEKINESNNIISDAFSEEKSYSAGDYAIYKDALYRFTDAKTAGVWDPETVSPVTVAGMVSELNGNMQNKIVVQRVDINHTGTFTHQEYNVVLPDDGIYDIINAVIQISTVAVNARPTVYPGPGPVTKTSRTYLRTVTTTAYNGVLEAIVVYARRI